MLEAFNGVGDKGLYSPFLAILRRLKQPKKPLNAVFVSIKKLKSYTKYDYTGRNRGRKT